MSLFELVQLRSRAGIIPQLLVVLEHFEQS